MIRLVYVSSATKDGFSEFLDKKMQPHEFAANPNEVVELLYNFKQNI